jgi:hypothetical protein
LPACNKTTPIRKTATITCKTINNVTTWISPQTNEIYGNFFSEATSDEWLAAHYSIGGRSPGNQCWIIQKRRSDRARSPFWT